MPPFSTEILVILRASGYRTKRTSACASSLAVNFFLQAANRRGNSSWRKDFCQIKYQMTIVGNEKFLTCMGSIPAFGTYYSEALYASKLLFSILSESLRISGVDDRRRCLGESKLVFKDLQLDSLGFAEVSQVELKRSAQKEPESYLGKSHWRARCSKRIIFRARSSGDALNAR